MRNMMMRKEEPEGIKRTGTYSRGSRKAYMVIVHLSREVLFPQDSTTKKEMNLRKSTNWKANQARATLGLLSQQQLHQKSLLIFLLF
jgi:hypothetical protein